MVKYKFVHKSILVELDKMITFCRIDGEVERGLQSVEPNFLSQLALARSLCTFIKYLNLAGY